MFKALIFADYQFLPKLSFVREFNNIRGYGQVQVGRRATQLISPKWLWRKRYKKLWGLNPTIQVISEIRSSFNEGFLIKTFKENQHPFVSLFWKYELVQHDVHQ